MSAQVDQKKFLRTIKESGLLTGKQFRKLVAQVPAQARPRSIARALVQTGTLSRFQASHLLQGRSRGFFLGPYRILDLLGQGGMGRVYKAQHQTMNRTVALKVLAPHLLKTPKARRLFQREVQAAAQLNHPNIVTAYDAGQIERRHFLAMEYVDGPNLEQLVRGQGPLPVGQACEIIRQAACGLQAAAEQEMVHRDIKPANLLLQRGRDGQDYRVKILDFGLARLNEASGEGRRADTILTPAHTVMGTPDFISPEQARDLHQVDIRSDLYSLGCTFYFLLTGLVPHPGGSALEKLVRHGRETPMPVEELRPGVIPEVANIVRKLMAKAPEDRFQTPEELAEALESYAELTAFIWQRPVSDPDIHLPTPHPVENSDLPIGESGEALVGTVPPEMAPTPLSGEVSDFPLEVDGPRLSWKMKAAWGAIGFLVAAGLGLAGYFAMGW